MKHKSNTTCFSFFNVTLVRCFAIYRSEIITVCTHPQMAPLGINSFLRMGIQLNLINELVPVKHQTSIQKLFPKSIGTHAEHCAAGSATNSLFHSSCPFGFVDRKAPVDNNLIDCLCHEFPVHFLPVFLWQPELYREKEQTPIGKRLLCEKLQTCHLINVICFISLNYFTPAPIAQSSSGLHLSFSSQATTEQGTFSHSRYRKQQQQQNRARGTEQETSLWYLINQPGIWLMDHMRLHMNR